MTKLDEAEDALFALLGVAATDPLNALHGVQLVQGNPGAGLLSDAVWVDDDASFSQVPDLTGNLNVRWEETIHLTVGVFTIRKGDDFLLLRDRIRDMENAVEVVLEANPTLSGTVFGDTFLERADRRGGRMDSGRWMELLLNVTTTAYLP